MPKDAYSTEVSRWESLNRSLRNKKLPPAVEEQRQAVEDALAVTRRLRAEYIRHRGEMLKTAHELRQAVAGGKRAASRLRSFLKGLYGLSSLALVRHGLKPRRRSRGEPPEGPLSLDPLASPDREPRAGDAVSAAVPTDLPAETTAEAAEPASALVEETAVRSAEPKPGNTGKTGKKTAARPRPAGREAAKPRARRSPRRR